MSVDMYKGLVTCNKHNIRNNILEEGIGCYTHWLSVQEGNFDELDINVDISLKQLDYEKNILIIQDRLQNLDIKILINNGFPECTLCQSDDCAHIGFAICLIQNKNRENLI